MKKIGWNVKLIMLFVGILSMLLILQMFYVIPYIRNQEITATKLNQQEIANNIARELNIGLKRIEDRLLRMAGFPEFRNMNIEAMQRIILEQERISERITTIAVMNSEGRVVFVSTENLSAHTTRSYADKPCFTIPFNEGKPCFAPPRYYAGENIVSTSIYLPIESESGERVGVIIGGMDLDDMIRRVADYPLTEGQVAYIIDKEGTVAAHSNIDLFALEDGPLSLNYSKRPMTQAIIKGEKGRSQEYKLEGIHHFGTYTCLESNGWGVVVTASMESIFTGLKIILKNILLINILFFTIAIICTIIFSQQITAAQRKAEKALKESEAKYRLMVEISQDAIVIYQNDKFVFINNAFAKMLDHNKEHLISEKIIDKLKEFETRPNNGEDMANRYETMFERKDGTEIYVEANITIIDYKGQKAAFAVIRDITKQKEIINTLQKSADQSKGLKGFIPICAGCNKIRNDEKENSPWISPAEYITERLPDIKFSHGMCPDCMKKWYPDYMDD